MSWGFIQTGNWDQNNSSFLMSLHDLENRGNGLQSNETSCVNWGNELQPYRTNCVNRRNELKIRRNELHIKIWFLFKLLGPFRTFVGNIFWGCHSSRNTIKVRNFSSCRTLGVNFVYRHPTPTWRLLHIQCWSYLTVMADVGDLIASNATQHR